jgi:hypothetical protein
MLLRSEIGKLKAHYAPEMLQNQKLFICDALL